MLSYSKDPNIIDSKTGEVYTVVDTFTGKKEYRRNCINVKGIYYIKDEDIFYIEDKETWFRKSSNKIEKDYETGKWYLKNTKCMNQGIVGFDENKKAIIGGFTSNPYNNCWARPSGMGKQLCLNPDILLENGFFEDIASGEFYERRSVNDRDYREMIKIRQTRKHTNKGYTVEENAAEFEEKKKLYANYNLKIGEDAKRYGKFLSAITFGTEQEASEGDLPDYIQNRHGSLIVRDGSLLNENSGITGPEHAIVPMQGAKGVQNIINFCYELQKRNKIDISCSLHIHFGNLPTSRIYLVALYMLFYSIQDELFKMFPYYKTDHRGIKRKNYCQKLPKMSIYGLKDFSKEGYEQFVDEIYKKIFEWLSEGVAADSEINRTNARHPRREKWNQHARYHALNVMNMIFSKSRTVEMRLHEASQNPMKVVNWLFISRAILGYAEDNMQKIIKGDRILLKDVLNFYKTHFKGDKDATFLSNYLNAYYDKRCAIFAKDLEKGDKISQHLLDNDNTYRFNFEGKSLFVK